MSVCAYHDSAPDQNPKQDVSCIGASLKITLKVARILQHCKKQLFPVVVKRASYASRRVISRQDLCWC